MQEENRVNKLMSGFSYRLVTILCGGLLLSGCVMAEKYDVEKQRSLNFQRLLAQEEKRTGELDNEAKRSKKELMEFEARNRELTAQLQAVREQLARVQEEAEAMKEAALLERKAKADMKRAMTPGRKMQQLEAGIDMSALDLSTAAHGMAPDVSSAPGTKEAGLLERKAKADMKRAAAPGRKTQQVEAGVDSSVLDLSTAAPGMAPDVSATPGPAELSMSELRSPTVHIVKPGETLYRISRKYGVSADKIRKWNKLKDDIVEVGQKLIVGQE